MRVLLLFILIGVHFSARADFKEEASSLAEKLKKDLMAHVSSQIKKGGVISAISFCHEEALPITNTHQNDKFNIGRTSQKIRNPKNRAANWMMSYLEEAKATTAKNPYKPQVVRLKEGKKVFLSPLYVGAPCMQCHGKLTQEVSAAIIKRYPNDEATDYQLGAFRGFVWVGEK